MGTSQVNESVRIGASARDVWKLVSDPLNYPRWSPETRRIRRVSGAGHWLPGDTFVGTNKVWLPWSTQCTVVVSDESTMTFEFDVAFGPMPVARWGYRVLELSADECTLTESWVDRRNGPLGLLVRPAGLFVGRGRDAAARNLSNMRTTLAAVKSQAEAGA